jgi:flavin reductase (DIM6/NTAB) family NADH-FMN oxidoreductase RutF
MSEVFFEPDQLRDAGALAALGLDRNPVTALVLPRPIAWISTLSAEGIANLAPFSFSGMVSQSPAMVMFCANASHVDGGEKDTLRNVRATGEFVFNIATFELRHQMNASSALFERGKDEFDLVGLDKAASRIVKPPRVAQSPISLECNVVTIVDLPPDDVTGQRNCATIGRIVGVHVKQDLIREGKIDIMQSRPLARLGYLNFATCDDVFTMQRP